MYSLKGRIFMRDVKKLERALVKGNVEETMDAMLQFLVFEDESMSLDDMDTIEYNECLDAILKRIKTGRNAGN